MISRVFSGPACCLLVLPLIMAMPGCDGGSGGSFELGGYRYRTDAVTRWALPTGLSEISGLALDPRQRLFGHGDEAAIIYQIDYRAGRTVKRFAFGDPPVKGDFEGIAWADGLLYLVTSNGELLSGKEGADEAHVGYRQYDTGLGQRCEIEGLEYDAASNVLLMPCKEIRDPDLGDQIVVLAWSLEKQAPVPAIGVPRPRDGTSIHPSGLTISSANDHLIVVAARQRALLEFTRGGTLVSAVALPRDDHHPQMEGIAMSPAGDLIIADEGGASRGRLSVYSPNR